MAVPPQAFPPRKRRPSAGAFMSPKFSDQSLLRSLLHLCQEISSLESRSFLLRRTTLSMTRKAKLLAFLFEDLVRSSITYLSPSALLCFQEMYILLQRIQTLIEDSSHGSKMWLLIQNESLANSFHELTLDLSTLLDILPVKELNLNEDVEEVVALLRAQCARSKDAFVDPKDDNLRLEVCSMLDRLKKEIIPDHSKLSEIFVQLGILDSSKCKEELESLQDEFQNQADDKSKSQLVSLIGLVRYAKCVLFGASTPSSDLTRLKSSSELNLPADFRCPISLELMRDPVAVATGQTYDRESIKLWIESGHNTCPKTGQTLAHTNLIPNRALKNLIAMWCREQRIPFEHAENKDKVSAVKKNKAALEATRMTASFLVNKLSLAQSIEAANGVVYELRSLAKTDSDCRACIAEAGAIPLLVRHLGSDAGRDHPNLQVNAVTTILNLSILEANKARIMDTDGALNGVIEVLRSGATWEAKGNAAATIFSLSGVQAYRKKLGRKARVIKALVDLAREGPGFSKRDAMVAILNLAGEREAVAKLVECGVVEMTMEVMEGLPEEAVTVLEVVVRGGGMGAIAAAYGAIRHLGVVLREGSDRARESAAATLVTICRKGGSEMVAELVSVSGIERVIWELMGTGTVRARRKAASLLRILRRWAAGLEGDQVVEGYSTIVSSSTTAMVSG
ncbi:putative aminoacyltransferase, E1 ubiquitin-activating enzyme [Rosa chinensis]|uniref:RING-type E3 ubiquitin transferase n=1 Tax=Rosa chinensis TaxID=74649 RepID=A0A2P6R8H6_ROSCH|nr:U-box domain-containing protein 16 [Rosa chinensis]PRQ42735.1 putative aminoacyltransferase, E1 ubiquitin-activating enzyme [Rosa chinensis]